MFYQFYQKTVLTYSKIILCFYLLLSIIAGYYSFELKLDASPDSLSLKHDKDLEYYRLIKEQYGDDSYLIITYAPLQDDLFSQKSLTDLKLLRDKLRQVSDAESVTTILDVPLLESPDITLTNALNNIRRLEDNTTDKNQAKDELVNSPLYQNALISKDASVTAILLKFKRDNTYYELLKKRDDLSNKQSQNTLSDTQKSELILVTKEFNSYKDQTLIKQDNNITDIRKIISEFTGNYHIYIGGIPMILADSINYIKNDIKVFGLGVLIFIIATLLIIFRSVRCIIAPLIICFVTVITSTGLLSFIGWPISLVSSNFISLLLIITLSMSIHLLITYKEICINAPSLAHKAAVLLTIKKILPPCIYTSLTTIVAFYSLVVSDIKPVIDFGYIMIIGIIIAFTIVFTLLPNLLPKAQSINAKNRDNKYTILITDFCAKLVCQKSLFIFLIFIIVTIFGIIGITKLRVENSFINYYKQSTPIYQGMKIIDDKLGGTTTLNIVIDAPHNDALEEDEEFDDFLFVNKKASNNNCRYSGGYWFNSFNLKTITEIHNYLDSLPETGKVMSLANANQLFQSLNQGKAVDTFFLNILCAKIPDDIKDLIFAPYIAKDGNQIHFNIRIIESSKTLKRNELITKIRSHLINEFHLPEDSVHLNGMLVLYNNILNSLFNSQIAALFFVFLAIFIMFIILFRSFMLAVIAIIPNALVAVFVLGLMGGLNIALDIMTITIAAIGVGIAVDDTIHYIHRFKNEIKKDYDYKAAIKRSHHSVGKAMFYTTVTIAFGFAILIFSNFIPTIYFGSLTAFSMVIALLLDFLLLPSLILWLKPFKHSELR